jgi:MerR family transcriptional regulator, thiopeptide resistance regulator
MTVRALYHYDEIGLLAASERTASGHRRYTERDLRRLYRVRALRALGLSLQEVAGALADPAHEDPAGELASMRDLLAAQLRRLEEHAEHIERLQQQIQGLLGRIDDRSVPDPGQFMTTLEMISMFETYFTQEQREQLAERRTQLGEEAVEAARHDFAGFVEEGLRHVEAGTPAVDPQVRDLVRRWDALGDMFHSEEQTKAVALRMWQDNSAEISRRLPWSAEQMTGLMAYFEQVRQADQRG